MSTEISRYEKAMKLSDADFKQIIGVTKETFDTILNSRKNYMCVEFRANIQRKTELFVLNGLFSLIYNLIRKSYVYFQQKREICEIFSIQA